MNVSNKYCFPSFHVLLGHMCVFFGKMSIQLFYSFVMGCLFFIVCCMHSLYTWGYSLLIRCMTYKYFLLFSELSFLWWWFHLLCKSFSVLCSPRVFLFFFPFVSLAWEDISRKILLRLMFKTLWKISLQFFRKSLRKIGIISSLNIS